MVSPIAQINRANRLSQGVSFLPRAVAAPPPRRPVRRDQQGMSLAQRILAHPEALPKSAPAAGGGGGGGGMSGLGWIVGKPLQMGLSALEVLDYPRAAVTSGIRELLDTAAAEQLNRAVAKLPGVEYSPIQEEGAEASWGDFWNQLKGNKGFGELIVEPAMGAEGTDRNIWARRALGFAGDVAADPFSYVTAGTKATFGGAPRAEYANKLLDMQQEVAKRIARDERSIASLAPVIDQPTFGYGNFAKQVMEQELARAQRQLPKSQELAQRLGGIEDIERIGRQGVNVASPWQLEAMGVGQHALRFGGAPIPGTRRVSEAISRATGPVKARISETGVAGRLRNVRTPRGAAGQDLRDAMRRVITGEGSMSMERALRTVKLDQWIREGVDNVVARMGPKMVEAARQAGVQIPELQGQQYVPHVMSREAFRFLDKMRKGKNPLVDAFRRKIGITADDLLEEGGFLQRRIFRPNPDGTPLKLTIGRGDDKRVIEIVRGDLAELEDKLGGVLREAGFEGKLYETDPVEVWKRYIIATERDVGKRFAAKQGAQRGYEGLYVEPRDLGPEGYEPVVGQPIRPRGPGAPAREMMVANRATKPADTELFEYVEDVAATEKRNEAIAARMPRPKKAQGLTQREILGEFREAAQGERERLAGAIDVTAEAAWTPHREAMRTLKEEESAARKQVDEAVAMGQEGTLALSKIDDALAEADREIASLQGRIGALTRNARRKIEVQSQMLLDQLQRELDDAIVQRERMMGYYNDAIARSERQLPAAKRRAAIRTEIAPARRMRKLRGAVDKAATRLRRDRELAENYLRGQSLDPKSGKSTWLSKEAYEDAQRRLDDPKLQRQYNALFEERNAIASERTRLADEAADHERNQLDAVSRANRAKGTYEEETQLAYALEQKRLANQKKAESERLLGAYNTVQDRINRSPVSRDRLTVQKWNRQQRNIDRYSQDVGLGRRIDVGAARRELHKARNDLAEFERQVQHEAAYQAEPPPRTLTEHYERELTGAERTLQEPRSVEYDTARTRLAEVEKQLARTPEPKPGDVSLPEPDWNKRGTGLYELKTGDGELDRYVIDHIVIPASEAPAGYGRVDYWAVTLPGEMVPDIAANSLREARSQVLQDRQLKELGRLRREHTASVEALTTEKEQLRQFLEEADVITGANVRRAERVTQGAAEHTARQAEMERLRGVIDTPEGQTIQSRLNARDDLTAKLAEPEPTWDPNVEKRAVFDARHAAWEQGRVSARKQLAKVNRQLRETKPSVDEYRQASGRLRELQAQEAAAFEAVPKAQRPPFFAELEAENARKIAAAGDVAAQQRGVAAKWEPPAAEAVAAERMAAAKLGRAGAGMAEQGPEGLPSTVAGAELQYATEAMPEIASARQRISELHAGKALNEADRVTVEDAQAAWFAPYNQGVENQRVARARYAEIEQRAEGLRKPYPATSVIEGKRGGRPYNTTLEQVHDNKIPAYEAQPMYTTIKDIKKIVAANPTGDDALVKRIEAEVGNHLTHLDRLTREYDLPAAQLEKIIKDASAGKLAPVLKRQLKEGFTYLYEGGDIIIDKELKAIYFNVSQGLDSKLFGRTLTMLTDFFKTYATLTPGFHFRNGLSAIFMNSSEGVKMATQMEGVKLWRQWITADDPAKWMTGQTPEVQAAFRATFASGAGGQFLERGVSELRTGGVRMSERVFANRVTRLSQRVGADWVEGPVRLALALDSTRGGMNITDAINRVTRIHFDYGQVSTFDEKAKRVIPFWTFMSRNVPLQFTQMWMKPRTYLRYQSFVRNMTLGVEQDPLLPEYIRQAGGFDTGVRTPTWMQGIPLVGQFMPPPGMPVVLQPDLPHTRLQEDVRRTAAALSGENTGQILSDVNPFFTAPFEHAMGTDFFTGKRYEAKDWSQASGAGIPLAALLSPIGGGKRGPNGEWYLQDKTMNTLRSVIPPLDRTARLTPGVLTAEPKGGDRMLESYLRFLGAPVRTISEDQKRAEAARRYYQERDRLIGQAVTGG